MSLARVQAVMAAGIEQPRLLVRWRAQPDRLRALGVDPAEIDLDVLAKFSGLGVKVRHNPLRAHYPLSFRLMSATAMEIAMFATCATKSGTAVWNQDLGTAAGRGAYLLSRFGGTPMIHKKYSQKFDSEPRLCASTRARHEP